MPFYLDLCLHRNNVFVWCACSALLFLASGRTVACQGKTGKEAAPVLEGRVSDPAGKPIPKAVLRLETEKSGSSANASIAKATTGDDGKFVLEAPSAGHYTLSVAVDTFNTLVMSHVTLASAERRHIDLTLEPSANGLATPAVQFSDEPNFAVAGITDRSNMGLHGSDASARTSDALAKETAALKSGASSKSDDSGPGDAHRLAADAKEKSGDHLDAVKEYEAAVRADPSEQNYFSWGAELLLHHAGQAAAQVFSNGAKAHPDSPRMLAGLGAAYYSTGKYNEAAAQLCHASDRNPADAEQYLFLGEMERAASDTFPCSEAALSRFAMNQPANPQANFLYGLVLWKKARKTLDVAGLARAEQFFQKALKLRPDFAEVYLQLGMLYNARGEKGPALAAFEKAVNADPKSSQAHYQLSLAYRRSGDTAKADSEMKAYDELRRSEDAALEKERRELRQFVTILGEGKSARP